MLSSSRSLCHAVAALAAFASLACSSGEPEATGDDAAPEMPCEVREVLERRCLRCHAEPLQYGAPYALTDLERLQAPAGDLLLYERMRIVVCERRMPPKFPAEPPVEPLSEGDRELLLAWRARRQGRAAPTERYERLDDPDRRGARYALQRTRAASATRPWRP